MNEQLGYSKCIRPYDHLTYTIFVHVFSNCDWLYNSKNHVCNVDTWISKFCCGDSGDNVNSQDATSRCRKPRPLQKTTLPRHRWDARIGGKWCEARKLPSLGCQTQLCRHAFRPSFYMAIGPGRNRHSTNTNYNLALPCPPPFYYYYFKGTNVSSIIRKGKHIS